MSLRAVVFDLDNCLAGRRGGRGALRAGVRCDARSQPRPPVGAGGWAAFAQIEVRRPLRGYGDLGALAALPVPRFLVTSGFGKLQESKIRMLGIRDLFEEIHVDAIDAPPRLGKAQIFRDILAHHGWQAGEVLVVGDNADSEIAAGNALGMPTVQVQRPGVVPAADATRQIDDLAALSEVIRWSYHSTPVLRRFS